MNELTQQNQQIAVFKNNELTANLTVALVDNEVWIVAGGLAKSLEYDQTANMLKLCDEPQVLDELNKNNNLAPATKWINEGDMYSAIFNSTKPEAKKFKRWVTHEVLPSMRKTGGYLLPGANQQLSLIEENKKLDLIVKQHEKYLEVAEERYEHTLDIFSWLEVKTREFDRIINDIAWKVYEKERNAMKKPAPKK